MSRGTPGLTIGFMVALLGGCVAGPPVATPADAARANRGLAELQRGRVLLVARCGSCHRPPMPSDRGVREWPGMLDEMSGRANLDATQRQLIEVYLITMATR
jgi:mono/diheme cytochrome c family protein